MEVPHSIDHSVSVLPDEGNALDSNEKADENTPPMIYDFEPGTNRDFDVIRAGDIFDTENEEIKRLDDEIALMSDKLTASMQRC